MISANGKPYLIVMSSPVETVHGCAETGDILSGSKCVENNSPLPHVKPKICNC